MPTQVFAMPCNGQCPNVGRMDSSLGSTQIVEKMKPRFRGRDLGFAIGNCSLMDYWSLPTVSSVETGLR